MTILNDCSKCRTYDNNNNSVSDYVIKAFDYPLKGLFAE